ncbi:MAG: DNA adenine methylase, partial [Planctomycetota bacterium]
GFSSVIARAHLEGEPGWPEAIEWIDPEADLRRPFQRNLRMLERLAPEAVAGEERLLPAVAQELSGGEPARAAEEYRELLASPPVPDAPARTGASPDRPLAGLIDGLLRERRRSPETLPYGLVTLLHANVYFGLRQAMVIDSIRAAIDHLPRAGPFRERRRDLYLAALLHAVSVSTSGTSHFAQPRSVRKDIELNRVARRRLINIEVEFHRALDAMRREWAERPRDPGNRVFELSAEELLAPGGPLHGEDVGLVYLDPPYTADNYSRFYHLLETLVAYDYPELERRCGRVTRGRYPVRARRYSSDFCKPDRVEEAFRRVIEGTRALGARLLVSYGLGPGLLLKCWAAEGSRDPLARFRALFREQYPRVEIRQRALMHSGQGDSNRKVRELLVLCEA